MLVAVVIGHVYYDTVYMTLTAGHPQVAVKCCGSGSLWARTTQCIHGHVQRAHLHKQLQLNMARCVSHKIQRIHKYIAVDCDTVYIPQCKAHPLLVLL